MRKLLLAVVVANALGCGSKLANDDGDPTDPVDDPDDTASIVNGIATGRRHACAIAAGGTVKCWGEGTQGQLGNGNEMQSGVAVDVVTGPVDPMKPAPAKLEGAIAVVAGYDFSCALLASHAVRCWGDNGNGALGTGDADSRTFADGSFGLDADVTAIAAGDYHACAIKGGAVMCWGDNSSGQLGRDPDIVSAFYVPIPIMLRAPALSIAAGSEHTCAQLEGGGVQCWGYGEDGELGQGQELSSFTPVDVVGLGSDVVRVIAGGYRNFALTGGTVKAWGYDSNGELGAGKADATAYIAVDAPEAAGAKAIGVGDSHTCVILEDRTVKCFGYNYRGQLGSGDYTESALARPVAGLADVDDIAAGETFTCALKRGSAPKCWGDNAKGQLGNGYYEDIPTPMVSPGLDTATSVAFGAAGGCGLFGGAVKCWGSNSYGQLGTGSGSTSELSGVVAVPTLASGVTAIGYRNNTACAVANGVVYCWGYGASGNLGLGTTTSRSTPTQVTLPGNPTATAITVGGSHACAVAGGAVFCWGANSYGQLGTGSTAQQLSPAATNITTGATAVFASEQHTCAIVNGDMRCWGYNPWGQVGSSGSTVLSPTTVSGMTANVTSACVSQYHSCAVQSGAVKCWGYGYSGQLGSGSLTQSSSPQQATGLTAGATSVACGDQRSCAVVGTALWCWGSAVGNGSAEMSKVPVQLAVSEASGATGGSQSMAVKSASGWLVWGRNTGAFPSLVERQSTTPVQVVGF